MEEKKVNIREMTMEDFEEVHALWMGIHGFGIRSIDDSKEGVERFIRRNPTTSMVACENDRIIGAILCGHDGRRGCLYHVCVHEDYRKQGIGQKMVEACLAALKREHVNAALGGGLLAQDQLEQGGFARARVTQQKNKLAVIHMEVDILQGRLCVVLVLL